MGRPWNLTSFRLHTGPWIRDTHMYCGVVYTHTQTHMHVCLRVNQSPHSYLTASCLLHDSKISSISSMSRARSNWFWKYTDNRTGAPHLHLPLVPRCLPALTFYWRIHDVSFYLASTLGEQAKERPNLRRTKRCSYWIYCQVDEDSSLTPAEAWRWSPLCLPCQLKDLGLNSVPFKKNSLGRFWTNADSRWNEPKVQFFF